MDSTTTTLSDTELQQEISIYREVELYLLEGQYPSGATKAEKGVLRRRSKSFTLVDGVLHYKCQGALRKV